jgi:hypothetical protein
VDLAGLEPATSQVRWIKIQGKSGKLLSITSNIAQNHHTTRCSPCVLFQHICTRIVPEGYSSMKQGKMTRSSVQRRENKVFGGSSGSVISPHK